MGAIITKIESGSIAEEMGFELGDEIISINGEKFTDALEYRFLLANEYVEVEVKTPDEIIVFEIEKEEYEDLGVEFETSLIDKPRSCKNKCIFCFIDQLPKGLRKPLYFKDDDTRLSFLTGNYVTLTNIDDAEIDKIIKIRLSPINISVHTTDDDLRVFMLKNPNASGICERIKKLTENGIEINCQIVLVKNVNDGEHLDKTIRDLERFFPMMHSLSVVPMGLTAHRENLFTAEAFTKEDSEKVIRQVEKIQDEFYKKHGLRIVYLADEFYIKAELPLPGQDYYEGFPQIENGVGLMTSLITEVEDELLIKKDGIKPGKKSIITGECAYKHIKMLAEKISALYPVEINVICAKNNLFGGHVSVTGLLGGKDIINAAKGQDLGEKLILSRSVLRAEGDLFLDDLTPADLEKELNIKIEFNDCNGKDFVEKILN